MQINQLINRTLIFLIFLTLFINNHIISAQTLRPLRDKERVSNDKIEVIVTPQEASIGDTVSVKVQRDIKNNDLPKIFFDKTKLPVFNLSNTYYRSLIPLSADFKPGSYKIEIFYNGHLKKIDLVVNPTKYPLQELVLKKETAALRASRIEKALVARTLGIRSSNKLWSGKFIYPSNSPQSTIYGVKRKINGVISLDYFHKGLDFAAPAGSNIRAPENGKVILSGYQSNGFVVNGNCIFLDHGHGVISAYLHLSKILVKEGELVKKGQIIGKVGSTGIASGPHLHWGIYVLSKTVNPLVWTTMIIE